MIFQRDRTSITVSLGDTRDWRERSRSWEIIEVREADPDDQGPRGDQDFQGETESLAGTAATVHREKMDREGLLGNPAKMDGTEEKVWTEREGHRAWRGIMDCEASPERRGGEDRGDRLEMMAPLVFKALLEFQGRASDRGM